jgi:hypothetical protein
LYTRSDLTDAFSRGTWLFIPKGVSVPRSRVATLHVVQTAARFIDPARDKSTGIVTLPVHGVDLRITVRKRIEPIVQGLMLR